MQFQKSNVIVGSYDVYKIKIILYNKGNVLKAKGGDSACPLLLPTPAHCDSALLPVLGVIAIGGAIVAGASRR
jgi:hypothetical protein